MNEKPLEGAKIVGCTHITAQAAVCSHISKYIPEFKFVMNSLALKAPVCQSSWLFICICLLSI